LDAATACPGDYVRQFVPQATNGFLLRLAVQAIEAWLLADREVCAEYLSVAESKIPQHPDLERNPKQTLLGLVRQSRNARLKRDAARTGEQNERWAWLRQLHC